MSEIIDMDGDRAAPDEPRAAQNNGPFTARPSAESDEASVPPMPPSPSSADNSASVPAASDPAAPPPGLALGEQVRAAYAAGERDFTNQNLAGADLRDADLQGSNFSGADLSGADLSRANLSQVNLRGAILSGAVLEHVNLGGADTSGIVMGQAAVQATVRAASPAAAMAGMAGMAAPVPMATGQFCAYCGTALPGGARFCQACGKPQPVAPISPGVPFAPSAPIIPLVYAPVPGANPPTYPSYPTYPTGAPAPTGYAPPSTPLVYTSPPAAAYGGYAPPSTPFVYGAPYAARTTPLQPSGTAPATPFRTTLTQQRSAATGMAIAAVAGAVAVLMFFLPGYLASGSDGLSGPQVASAFSALASVCGQYSQLVGQSSGMQGVCGFAGAAGPMLWLEAILAAVATAIASWQWYHQRQSSMPIEPSASWGVLITGGISLLILLFQFLEIPSLASSATGSVALGQAIGALFGYSFWLMVLGTAGVVAGAIVQLRR